MGCYIDRGAPSRGGSPARGRGWRLLSRCQRASGRNQSGGGQGSEEHPAAAAAVHSAALQVCGGSVAELRQVQIPLTQTHPTAPHTVPPAQLFPWTTQPASAELSEPGVPPHVPQAPALHCADALAEARTIASSAVPRIVATFMSPLLSGPKPRIRDLPRSSDGSRRAGRSRKSPRVRRRQKPAEPARKDSRSLWKNLCSPFSGRQ